MKQLLIALLLVSSSAAVASPRTSYLLHCAGCHLPDGRGAPPAVPTLRNTLGQLVQTPQGRDYLVRVPGASQAPISDGELATVINYTLLEFNRETLPEQFKPLQEKEVARSRPNILADPLLYRRQLWPEY
jgi:mono/diheme cytochrome c family protein